MRTVCRKMAGEMDRMIIVKIGDGMGNQLFNYACGYAQARREGERLVLDTSECDNSTLRDFELDKFHLKYDARESYPNRNVFQKIYKRLRCSLKYRVIREREVFCNRNGIYPVDDIDPRVFVKSRFRPKYLYGYWQHLDYFEEYLDEIREMMTPAYEQSGRVRELTEEFRSTPTCAVHVRGGDITGPRASYFARALGRMAAEKPGLRYVIFTNDRQRAAEALGEIPEGVRAGLVYAADLGAFSDVDEFFLMAACQNQILSNSTFSTWAAYLNKNPDQTVIMPEDLLSERMRRKGWLIL